MWEIGIVHQLTSSGYAIAVGILFAAVYDVLKACCIVFKANNFWVFVKDIVFSLFAFFVTFMLLMARSNGMVRAYILFWVFVGFLLFRISVSKIWLKFFMFIFSKLKDFLAFLDRILNKFCDLLDRFESRLLSFLKNFYKKRKNL